MSYEQEWLALADVLGIEGPTSPAKMVEMVKALQQVIDGNGKARVEILRQLSVAEAAMTTDRARWDAERARLRTALQALSDRHAGYEHGCGPCVCAEHVAARAALAGSPEGTPETPADQNEQAWRDLQADGGLPEARLRSDQFGRTPTPDAAIPVAEAPARAEAQPSPLIRASQKVVDFLRACEWNDRTSETDATDLAEELEQAIIARADEGRP